MLSYLYGDDDKPHRDPARDMEYTRELGEVIVRSYARDTVVMATHLVAAAAFDHLRGAISKGDLFMVLNHRDCVRVSREELLLSIGALIDRARDFERREKIVLSPQLRDTKPAHVLDTALRAFAGYHTKPVMAAGATDILLEDTRLLFYYQNRLAAHGLSFDAIKPKARA